MQKAFRDIVERLEEINFNDIQIAVSRVLEKYGFPRECVVQDEVWDELDGLCTSKPAIEIVNQVAETYEQEVCEWIPNFERKIFTGHYYSNCDDGMMFTKVEVESFNVCPYCGKKIKVVE